MSRIPKVSREEAPEGVLPVLERLEKQGRISNFLYVLANSPAALDAYLQLSGSLNKGTLPSATGRRIALAISEFNGSDYSLSANIHLARQAASLSDAEITANRSGCSNDLKAEAAVRFASAVARERGHVSQQQLDALLAAGYDHAQVVEIVLHVALAILSNYVNDVAGTEIDFPVIRSRKNARAPVEP